MRACGGTSVAPCAPIAGSRARAPATAARSDRAAAADRSPSGPSRWARSERPGIRLDTQARETALGIGVEAEVEGLVALELTVERHATFPQLTAQPYPERVP